MGLLNIESDGLPSVLFALIRTLQSFGPMSKNDLLASCCPTTLKAHDSSFETRSLGAKTLLRWTQLGLFQDAAGLINLHHKVEKISKNGFNNIRAIEPVLRDLLLDPANNRELNQQEGSLAADFTLSLSWVLSQDVFRLSGGAYKYVEPVEAPQFGTSEPWAFRNDTRWNGFRTWAPLIGFGWTESMQGRSVFVADPTFAVRHSLLRLFDNTSELPMEELLRSLATELPVLDGGRYRQAVESRLLKPAWRETKAHEVSISLSIALNRLDSNGFIRLESRADAPKRILLGRDYRELRTVSHVVKGDSFDA